MNDKVETILLKKTGENRMSIESIRDSLGVINNRLDKIDKRLTAAILLFESGEGQDREAYLRGETQ